MKEVIGAPFTFKDGRQFPFSQSVACAGLIFVSGQLAMDESNKIVGETIGEQTRHAISNISAILAQRGASLSDVVKTTVWLTDPKHFPGFNEEYAKHFVEAPPARATVCVALNLPGYLVEIEAVAADPQSR